MLRIKLSTLEENSKTLNKKFLDPNQTCQIRWDAQKHFTLLFFKTIAFQIGKEADGDRINPSGMFNTHQEKDVNVFSHSSRSDRGANVEFSRDEIVSPTRDAIGQGRRLFRQLIDAETSTEHRTLKTTRYPSTRPPLKTKKEKKKQKQSKSKEGGGRNKKTAAKTNKEGNKTNKKTSKAKTANNGKKNSKNSSKQSKKGSDKPGSKKNKASSKKKKKKTQKKTTTKKENKTSVESRNGSSENQERGTGLTN